MGARIPKISAEAKLETLLLYMDYQNTQWVAADLGIDSSTVGKRLHSLGIKLRPRRASPVRMEDINEVEEVEKTVQRLREEVAAERRELKLLPSAGLPTKRTSAADYLATAELYLQLQSCGKVARALGIAKTTVANRLRRLGIERRAFGVHTDRVEDYNDMEAATAVVERLKAEIASAASWEEFIARIIASEG